MYQINENCIACGNCIAECPEGAISEGEIYSINPDVCTDCGACLMGCSVGAIEHVSISPESPESPEKLEAFQDTGKYPPSKGDLIYLGNDGFGFVDKVVVEGPDTVVYFYATVYDYKYEGNAMAITQPDTMMMSPSYIKKPTESQMREFRKHLNEKNLTFDYGFKKVVSRAISRVETGSEYYYIDTDMADRSAIDDGLNSGIHYARFKQGNYFKSLNRISLVGKEIRNTLKKFIMPYGTWG